MLQSAFGRAFSHNDGRHRLRVTFIKVGSYIAALCAGNTALNELRSTTLRRDPFLQIHRHVQRNPRHSADLRFNDAFEK